MTVTAPSLDDRDSTFFGLYLYVAKNAKKVSNHKHREIANLYMIIARLFRYFSFHCSNPPLHRTNSPTGCLCPFPLPTISTPYSVQTTSTS